MGGEQDHTQLAVKILCNDSTGCDEEDVYFATTLDTMIDIVYKDALDEFIKMPRLNVTLLFLVFFSIHFSITRIRKYVRKKSLFITIVTNVHKLDNQQ